MIDQEIQAKLREKFNPDGSMLRKQQLRMLEILLYIDKVCKENNIPIQYTNSGSRTWTNADQIHFIGEGVPTMLLNIPLRYMHSSAEVANMDDVNNLSKLMYLIIKEITEDFSFNPYE